eukprot:Sdes_comp18908_c0_seq1m9357
MKISSFSKTLPLFSPLLGASPFFAVKNCASSRFPSVCRFFFHSRSECKNQSCLGLDSPETTPEITNCFPFSSHQNTNNSILSKELISTSHNPTNSPPVSLHYIPSDPSRFSQSKKSISQVGKITPIKKTIPQKSSKPTVSLLDYKKSPKLQDLQIALREGVFGSALALHFGDSSPLTESEVEISKGISKRFCPHYLKTIIEEKKLKNEISDAETLFEGVNCNKTILSTI